MSDNGTFETLDHVGSAGAIGGMRDITLQRGIGRS
jgi:hypothetical protein